jgi:hypothetical protein
VIAREDDQNHERHGDRCSDCQQYFSDFDDGCFVTLVDALLDIELVERCDSLKVDEVPVYAVLDKKVRDEHDI